MVAFRQPRWPEEAALGASVLSGLCGWGGKTKHAGSSFGFTSTVVPDSLNVTWKATNE